MIWIWCSVNQPEVLIIVSNYFCITRICLQIKTIRICKIFISRSYPIMIYLTIYIQICSKISSIGVDTSKCNLFLGIFCTHNSATGLGFTQYNQVQHISVQELTLYNPLSYFTWRSVARLCVFTKTKCCTLMCQHEIVLLVLLRFQGDLRSFSKIIKTLETRFCSYWAAFDLLIYHENTGLVYSRCILDVRK